MDMIISISYVNCYIKEATDGRPCPTFTPDVIAFLEDLNATWGDYQGSVAETDKEGHRYVRDITINKLSFDYDGLKKVIAILEAFSIDNNESLVSCEQTLDDRLLINIHYLNDYLD